MRRFAPILSLALLLALAPAAEAGWFPFERVDTSAAKPVVDLGIEEGGGLVYVKSGRAWLSRLGPAGWSAPAALSAGATTEAAVAAGAPGRLAVAWIQDGIVYGALAGGAPVPLSSGGGAQGLVIEMGVNGAAYAVWAQNGDVRAAWLKGATWQAIPLPLDVVPERAAGAGALRPKVAVAADGSALVVWGEVFPGGVSHVMARRVYGTTLSVLPQDAGSGSDSPEVDIEYDRTYAWVAFRQVIGGVSRSVARRLRASTFEPTVALDGGHTSYGPALGMSSSGTGHAVAVGGGLLYGAPLRRDRFLRARRSDRSGAVTNAVVATSERDDSALAWRAGPDATAVVRGRYAPEGARLGRERLLSRRGGGPVAPGPPAASSNRVGDVAVAFVQGGAVGVATFDEPPSAPALRDLPDVVGRSVLLRWGRGQDFNGPLRYSVLVDGRRAGTTSRTSLRIRLTPGKHRIHVISVDRRGQRSERGRRQTVSVRRG